MDLQKYLTTFFFALALGWFLGGKYASHSNAIENEREVKTRSFAEAAKASFEGDSLASESKSREQDRLSEKTIQQLSLYEKNKICQDVGFDYQKQLFQYVDEVDYEDTPEIEDNLRWLSRKGSHWKGEVDLHLKNRSLNVSMYVDTYEYSKAKDGGVMMSGPSSVVTYVIIEEPGKKVYPQISFNFNPIGFMKRGQNYFFNVASYFDDFGDELEGLLVPLPINRVSNVHYKSGQWQSGPIVSWQNLNAKNFYSQIDANTEKLNRQLASEAKENGWPPPRSVVLPQEMSPQEDLPSEQILDPKEFESPEG